MGRKAFDEIVFRGVKFVFNLRSRFDVIMRIDDQITDRLRRVDAVKLVDTLEKLVGSLTAHGMEVTSFSKTTLEHGYLLHCVVERGERRVIATVELCK